MKNGEKCVVAVDGLYRSVRILMREEGRRVDNQIRKAHDCVDFWKVGKLNHGKAVEQSALGPKFRDAATALLEHCGCKYYIKEDLRKAS